MGIYEGMTDTQRCEAGAGLHYQSREWDEIFSDGGGFDGSWPEIDRHGRLTGRIVGSEDGYLNVNDEAMISEAEAREGGWERPDEGYAEPPLPAAVEIASCDETVRICGGLEDFAGLEHPAIDAAAQAYRSAAFDSLSGDERARRIVASPPRGQRVLHSQWCGAKWGFSCGAIATMSGRLTDGEKAAISAADDAGRAAAQRVIEQADAAVASDE
jgi:hypothetical protein